MRMQNQYGMVVRVGDRLVFADITNRFMRKNGVLTGKVKYKGSTYKVHGDINTVNTHGYEAVLQ